MNYKTIITLFTISIYFACQPAKTEENGRETEHKHIAGQEIIVKTDIAKKEAFKKELISNGKLTAIKKANLHFITGGLLRKINIKNGSFVQKGQILAQLENTEQQNNYLSAKAVLEKANLEKQALLLEYAGSTDTASLSATIKKNLAVRSGYNAALVNLKQANYNLEKTVLKAPFSGKIANLKLKAHNLINSSDIICTLLDNSTYEAEFTVIESELQFIKQGQNIKVSTTHSGSVFYTGKISEINPMVNENGLVNIKALIKNPKGKLLDGMNIKITVSYNVPKQIIVPKEAVVMRSGNAVVFTYEIGLAKWKYVKISGENSTNYALSEGLNKGDTIIVSNNLNLAHDAFVKIEK